MSITITVVAESGEDARAQLEALLGHDDTTYALATAYKRDYRYHDGTGGAEPNGKGDGVALNSIEHPTPPEKPARATRSRKPIEAPSPQPDAPAETVEASAAPSAPEPSGSATTASDPPALTYDDVRTAILAVSEIGGRPAVSSVLDQFGVDNANKVDPSLWGEVIETANAKVAEIKANG